MQKVLKSTQQSSLHIDPRKKKKKKEKTEREEEVVSTHLKIEPKVKTHHFSLVCIGPKLLPLLGQIHA